MGESQGKSEAPAAASSGAHRRFVGVLTTAAGSGIVRASGGPCPPLDRRFSPDGRRPFPGKQTVKRTWFFIIVILLCLALGVFGYARSEIRRYLERPCGKGAVEERVTVAPGRSFGALVADLHRRGIVDSPLRLKLLARIEGYDKRIKAGEYLLSSRMKPRQLLEVLAEGRVYLYRVTIPEGFTLYQIARRLERLSLVSARDFIRAATDSREAARYGIAGPTFEGYLFPDTYAFARGVTPRRIIAAMVGRFREKFKPAWKRRARQLGMSVQQVVTLASIIEKETGSPAERPLIASVFHNRLKKGMRLESDPTVIYAIPDFDGNLTRRDLKTKTPYNTYRIKGLPAGPIANPGSAAIEAALYPAKTDFLYFVARRDGTHQFSRTLREHNRAVNKYQRGH